MRGFDDTYYSWEAERVLDPEKLHFDAKFDEDEGYVELAPGMPMPVSALATVYEWQGFTIKMTIKLVDGRYRCVDMHLFRSGEEITGEALRQLPIGYFVGEIITSIAGWQLPRPPELATHGPTQAILEHVAKIYRLAHAIGVSPTQRVAEEFDLKPSTAGRWVARAREMRLLEPAEKPGKAGG